MNAIETVRTLITALQSGDMELAATTMADDFILIGLTPEALAKGEFLAMQSELLTAMPDFSYNLSDIHKEGGEVEALIQINGTHTNDLSLPMLGLPTIRATGLAVTLPQVRAAFQTGNGKVVGMRCESVAGGGLSGLLQQVGAELPLLPREGNFSG